VPQLRRPLAPLTALALTAALAVGVPLTGPAHAADAEPVDGAQTSGDVLFPHVGNGGYDAQHYDVDLAWTPAAQLDRSTIEATATMQAQTTGAPLRSFSMDLEGLQVESVTVDGADATWRRTNSDERVEHKLVVTPATPVLGDFTVEVAYGGVPEAHRDADGSLEGWNATSDGATFLNQPVGAMTGFPHNNTPADKATWTFTLDVPTRLAGGKAAAVGNGVLASQTPSADGARTTWVWDQPRQMASELTIISIGRYAAYHDTIRLASGRELPEWTFVDPTISDDDLATTLASRAQQKNIIDRLETIYGPYPGAATGLVVDVVPDGINYALETQDRSFFPSSADRSTTVHEITHQWWGDAVSPRVWNDIWINEGMATWSETNYANTLAGTSQTTTAEEFYDEWAGEPAGSDAWTIPPAAMTDSADLFGFQTYSRGAMMYEALRTVIGDDDFHTFIRAWQDRYSGTSHGIDDFTALAEEVSGRDLDAFFTDWLLDADKPAWPLRDQVRDPQARIAGQPVVGRTLRAVPGRHDAGTRLSYRWEVGGRKVAYGRTLAVRAKYVGRRVKVTVVSTKDGYRTLRSTSPLTSPVRR